jgi:hypothetical protein
MSSEFPATNDSEEQLDMAATDITPKFDRLVAIATGIFAQLCADEAALAHQTGNTKSERLLAL